ncbi:SERTA domain-containing protein 2-like [Xyrichtys novacula]|uniref:SERTA domain-containing protein 2-like n=1 Tax=Xyrichtys novacula TaxID=13765 RepID=A0AAV1EW24_XYRNO|nr:SERTA domain-containing protein 2-like [Xyrichtys novacula]
MLGNGVKRKLGEGEDGLEEGLRPLAAAAGVMSPASFTLQRQTVLNMSLMKLYHPRLSTDLRLQRRVLINNIIRRIHDDLRQEGGLSALFFSTGPAVSAVREARQAPSPPPTFSILSSSLSGLTALDSCLTPDSLLEEDLPMFFTLPPSSSSSQHLHLHHSPRPPPPPPPPSPSPKDSFSSALEDIEELCPSSLASRPPSPPPARETFDVIMKEEEAEKEEKGWDLREAEKRLEKPPPLLPPPTPSSTSSFLTDFTLDDTLFTDIDTSMYDLGPCTPPSGAPPTKMSPVVMSGYGAAGGGGQNPPFKMDLAELDHIMEVLVGS